jgi:hypothetical protein
MTEDEIKKYFKDKPFKGHADEEIFITMPERNLILVDITVNSEKEIVAMKHDILLFDVHKFRIPWNAEKRKQFMEDPANQDRVTRRTAGKLTGKGLRSATHMLQTYNSLDKKGQYGSMLVAKHEWTPLLI